ncbi:MAG: hypothetical protein GXY05_00965 [Clostridiales bacterium]|nr:hypothetical protein [Clostridiales bacterium]
MKSQKKFLSTGEFAEKHQIHPANLRKLLVDKRIPGVISTGRALLIPEDAPLPKHGDKTMYPYIEDVYLSLDAYCKQTGASKARVISMFENDEIPEAVTAGGRMFLPNGLKLDSDKRVKSGSYVNWRYIYGKDDPELTEEYRKKGYIPIGEYAKNNKVSKVIMKKLYENGELEQAVLDGTTIYLPENYKIPQAILDRELELKKKNRKKSDKPRGRRKKNVENKNEP